MLTRSHIDHEVALQAAALVASAGDVVRGLQKLLAVGVLLALQAMGLNAAILSAFAPDLALVVAVAMALLCLPAAWRAWAWAWAHRAWVRSHGVRPP